MSDQTFSTPPALAVLEKVGMPEWEEPCTGTRYRLDRKRKGWVVRNIQVGYGRPADHHITDHEAACLIRDDLRVKLEERGYEINPTFFMAGKNGFKKYEAAGGDGEDVLGGFDDYDEGLLAAAEAALKETA